MTYAGMDSTLEGKEGHLDESEKLGEGTKPAILAENCISRSGRELRRTWAERENKVDREDPDEGVKGTGHKEYAERGRRISEPIL